jgi:hypothetical protein
LVASLAPVEACPDIIGLRSLDIAALPDDCLITAVSFFILLLVVADIRDVDAIFTGVLILGDVIVAANVDFTLLSAELGTLSVLEGGAAGWDVDGVSTEPLLLVEPVLRTGFVGGVLKGFDRLTDSALVALACCGSTP